MSDLFLPGSGRRLLHAFLLALALASLLVLASEAAAEDAVVAYPRDVCADAPWYVSVLFGCWL
jgi:hypothetical protein